MRIMGSVAQPPLYFDYEVLNRLNQLGDGDASFLSEIIEIFRRETRGSLDLMEAAIQRQNTAILSKQIHKMLSTSRNVGAIRLTERFEELNTNLDEADFERISKIFYEIRSCFEETERYSRYLHAALAESSIGK